MSNATVVAEAVPDMTLIVGPIYLGALMGYLVFGITIVQLYIYYVSFSKESWWLVCSVYGVFLLDVLQSVAIAATGWRTAVSGWGRPEFLEFPGWPLYIIPGASALIAAWVQIFYAWRIHRFGAWKIVPIIIVFFALAQCGAAWAIGIQFIFLQNVKLLHLPSMFARTIVWLGGGTIADLTIMFSMVRLLTRVRNDTYVVGRTELLVNKLIRLSVETGFICVTTAVIELILFLAYPDNNLHLFFSFLLSKVYAVTLMVNLNSRRTRLWNRTVSDDPPPMGGASAFTVPHVGSRRPPAQTVVHVSSHVEQQTDDTDEAHKTRPQDSDEDLELRPTRKFSRGDGLQFAHPLPLP